MKLVIKVSRRAIKCRAVGREFARSIAQLVHDKHFITLVHGKYDCLEYSHCSGAKAARRNDHDSLTVHSGSVPIRVTGIEAENRMLVTLLAEMRIPGLGLCASDAGLIQLRRQPGGANNGSALMQAAFLDPKWLDIICSHAGVPVLSNLCFCSCGNHHLIDPEYMAAISAVSWDADALIYLTHENGVPAEDGDIIRWLDVESINTLPWDRLSDAMQRRLQSCAMALKKGVRRAKILPLLSVASLADFYLSPLKYGTELINGRPVLFRG